jgi:outer membrane lipoprotein SlyB
MLQPKSHLHMPLLASVLIVLSSSLCGCTTDLTNDHYTATDVRAMADVNFGKILHLREVTIDGSNSGIGSNGGSSLGSIAGASNGFGLKSFATSAAGGMFGAIVGTGAEEAATRKHGLELIIQLDNGRNVAVVQEKDKTAFHVGQRVRVMVLGSGSRVVPDEDTLINETNGGSSNGSNSGNTITINSP